MEERRRSKLLHGIFRLAFNPNGAPASLPWWLPAVEEWKTDILSSAAILVHCSNPEWGQEDEEEEPGGRAIIVFFLSPAAIQQPDVGALENQAVEDACRDAGSPKVEQNGVLLDPADYPGHCAFLGSLLAVPNNWMEITADFLSDAFRKVLAEMQCLDSYVSLAIEDYLIHYLSRHRGELRGAGSFPNAAVFLACSITKKVITKLCHASERIDSDSLPERDSRGVEIMHEDSPNQETRIYDVFRAWGPVAYEGALVTASEVVEVIEEVLEEFSAFLEHRIPVSSDLSFGDCRRNQPEPRRSPPHYSRRPFPFQEVRVPIYTLEAHAEKVAIALLQMMKRSFDQMMTSAAIRQSLFFESQLIDLILANFRPFEDLWDMLRQIQPSPPSAAADIGEWQGTPPGEDGPRAFSAQGSEDAAAAGEASPSEPAPPLGDVDGRAAPTPLEEILLYSTPSVSLDETSSVISMSPTLDSEDESETPASLQGVMEKKNESFP
ncbi:uncharacterized protein LOC129346543 [Eublepharis macularius]|uniref:Uncharacterized protein LOC129346543 n=1 Tax=Eublepharis macularius TaxID=481883 RepID=A0AA97KQ95_EUBMA|nr:uncharacterized protein LOC129346543 [Eublepharis macularius]